MEVRIGNLFESNAKTLVNTVNCVGVMGKGIALEFKKRYPLMFDEYQHLCAIGDVKPGQPYLYTDMEGNSVLQFPTKDHWRSPSQLQYIIDGLDWFRAHYQENGITSIAFPPLGCGNGGLPWDVVGPIMYRKLKDIPIDITIFAPYGTAPEKLSVRFLDQKRQDMPNLTGVQPAKINHYWYLIPYMVQQLNHDRYSLSVGRTILQKICFVLTREGIPMGFQFSRGAYGPFSPEIKSAIVSLTNANLIHEEQNGNMIRVQVAQDFVFDAEKYSPDELATVNRCLDLLSRIKNTDQAEMLATVMFSYDSLMGTGNIPSELEIVDFVENWKPHWKAGKHNDIISTMKGLSELRWIKPDCSKGIFSENDCF